MEKLCELNDIPEGSAKSFRQGLKPFFVVHRDGQYTAFVNWCPHLGIELNYEPDRFLDVEGNFIICVNHGALFETQTGQCLSGPCVGRNLISVPCETRDDGIYIGEVPDRPTSPFEQP
jgi:nitrite reductase/ring-hydroxylating ferredoxin subunit